MRMTKKIYMDNPYIKEIKGNILFTKKTGKYFHTILDQTIFYPDGVGGQRGDKGTINDIKILKSIDDAGKIIHLTEKKVPGSTALVKIDWENRFHIMQQHSAQHLVSSSFSRLFGISTVSFHSSENFFTIDLDIDILEDYQIEKVEELANSIVQFNFPVKSYFPEKEVQKNIKFRKKPKIEENLRVVEIDGIDYSACGGTHVNYTGELGLIKIIEKHKQNGKVRIKVLVGNDSLKDYQNKNYIYKELAEKLSANTDNLAEKFDIFAKKFEEINSSYKENKSLLFTLIKKLAEKNIEDLKGMKLLIEEFNYMDFSEAQQYSKFYENEDIILILYRNNNETINVLIKPCGSINLDTDLLMTNLKNKYAFKGGGNKRIIQGVLFPGKDTNPENLIKNQIIEII